jgi:hypothetical protein
MKTKALLDLFHLYRDRLNFVYQVDITRDNEFTGEFGQKYSLCVSKISPSRVSWY